MTITVKVYILLETYDNGESWEDHSYYHRQFAGVFPTEDAAKIRINELYNRTEHKSSPLMGKDGEYSWTVKTWSDGEEKYTYTIIEEGMKIEIES